MEKGLRKACYEQKLKIIDDAYVRVSKLILAHELASIKDYKNKKEYKKRLDREKKYFEKRSNLFPAWKEAFMSPIRKPTFSERKEMLDGLLSPWNIGDTYSLIGKDEPLYLEVETQFYAYSEHIFSNDPHVFINEFYRLFIAFSIVGEKHDPRGDLGLMKVLFHAGKMVERLNQEGVRMSDKQSEYGSGLSKVHVGYDAVFRAFYLAKWEGLKKITPISEKIRDYLLEAEKAKPKHKQKRVYCDKQIRGILKRDRKIRETLIAEGILKK